MSEREFLFMLIGTNVGLVIAIVVLAITALGWVGHNILSMPDERKSNDGE